MAGQVGDDDSAFDVTSAFDVEITQEAHNPLQQLPLLKVIHYFARMKARFRQLSKQQKRHIFFSFIFAFIINILIGGSILYFGVIPQNGFVQFRWFCFGQFIQSKYPDTLCFIAVGQFSQGVISLGQFSVGIISVGQIGAGFLFGLGQIMFSFIYVYGGQIVVTGYCHCAQICLSWIKVKKAQAGLAPLNPVVSDQQNIFVNNCQGQRPVVVQAQRVNTQEQQMSQTTQNVHQTGI